MGKMDRLGKRHQQKGETPSSSLYDGGVDLDYLEDILSASTDNSGLLRDNQDLQQQVDKLRTELELHRAEIDNALVRSDNGLMRYKRFSITRTGMSIPEDATDDELGEIGTLLISLDASLAWAIGDWAAFLCRQRGFQYRTIAEHFGYTVETLQVYASVCDSIGPLIRNQGLTFSHHRWVAGMNPGEQRKWLTLALENNWKVKELADAIKAQNRPALPPKPDPVGINTMQKSTKSLGKTLMRASGAGRLKAKEVEEARQQIDKMRQWLAAAESLIDRVDIDEP